MFTLDETNTKISTNTMHFIALNIYISLKILSISLERKKLFKGRLKDRQNYKL
jgi:hypothetical protein